MAAKYTFSYLSQQLYWKIANIVLIYIKSPTNNLENYRAVRLSSGLGNLTGRMIKNAVIKNPRNTEFDDMVGKKNCRNFVKECCTSLILYMYK